MRAGRIRRIEKDQGTQVWPANSVLQYRYGRLCSQVSEFFELKGMFLRILQWAVRPKCPVEEHSFQLYEFTDLLVQPPREPPLQRIQRSGIVQSGILTTHHAFDRVLNFLNGF